jgi:acetolactate synthase-1/2/3 large subunit
MDEVKGGQLLVEALQAEGMDTVFGLIGSHVTEIYNALLGAPQIRHIAVRHEQAAAYMADGYARATGRPGVCVVTAGPGATNTLTATATAFADSSPTLTIAGQVPSHVLGLGKGVFHESPDQLGIFRPVTGWTGRPRTAGEIPRLVHAAFRALRGRRPRPAYLEIPCDLLEGTTKREPWEPRAVRLPRAPEAEVRKAAACLRESAAPALWAGGGVIRSGASEELRALAETLGAPVFTTCNGKGAIPADHDLALDYWLPAADHGAPPRQRRRRHDLALDCRLPAGPAVDLLNMADLVLAVGTRFTAMATGGWRIALPRLLQVDIDPSEIGKNYPVEVGLVGDAKIVLRQIREALAKGGFGERPSRAADVARVRGLVHAEAEHRFPEALRLLRDVRATLDRDAIVVCDITTLATLGRRYFPVYEPMTFLCPLGFGTLGYAFPAALGAKVGQPERQVVAVCGDGGFLFNAQELATAVQDRLSVVVLLINDGGYGAFREWQRKHGSERVKAVDLLTPDFMLLAQAFGAVGMRAKGLEDVGPLLKAACKETKPVLLEVPVALQHPGFG